MHRLALRVVTTTALLVLSGAIGRSTGTTGDVLHAQSSSTSIRAGDFTITYDPRGMTGIAATRDQAGAQVVAAGARLGLMAKYRVDGGDWLDLYQDNAKVSTPAPQTVAYSSDVEGTVLRSAQTFHTDGRTLDWTVEIANRMRYPVEVGDLAFVLPWRAPGGEDAEDIFERSWTKHQFISGHGSFLYFVRPSGAPPYLVVTTLPGTSLEYVTPGASGGGGRGAGFQAFVHSALTGGSETRGSWRQPHTNLVLSAAGSPEAAARYGLRFRWASSYDEIRNVLYDEGLFDVRVVPGMTVPEDLDVRLALHTKAQIETVLAEYGAQTTITPMAAAMPGYHVYRVRFARLGENRLTIIHDGQRQTHLEFFVTEPLETLIKKRANFLVTSQQHRDASKWYDGLFSVWDMRAKQLRSPDNSDGFVHWWGYVVAADDPVLGKAPFLASKNLRFPVQSEIAAIEYYLQHFVWGKLQRTDEETPYPWGLHGVPNWIEARDPRLQARSRNDNLDKMKIWRSYDYPHMVMLYFHMYEIATAYPSMVKYLDANGYLERAYQTARAYFTYPYEILPWYETYKWGCYNELVIPDLMAALERTGQSDRAAWLRGEWEKKVKYFVYDDTYPFRSEYAIDRTAFESSYALAKYGATHDMAPDTNLWFDKNLQRWYSHPSVKRADSRAFMDRQLRAGLAVRGWLEPAYYLLGADFTASSDTGSMSYMANMGGWGILDYALAFAPEPWDWLQLGYASYLSSWALMNTGRPDTNFGFWFPGPENDGASGWQFMTAKYGRGWIRKDMPRGPWHYDGEIDLGYGAGLRMAATIVADDPVFGLIAYGGTLSTTGPQLSVVPRDGLRQRFGVVLPAIKGAGSPCPPTGPCTFRMELGRDGFRADSPVDVDRALKAVTFTLENRTGDAHTTPLRLSLPSPTGQASAVAKTWQVRLNGQRTPIVANGGTDYPFRVEIPTPPTGLVRVEIRAR
jgi:hypothetical protein